MEISLACGLVSATANVAVLPKQRTLRETLDLNQLISSMQGGTFFIHEYLYNGVRVNFRSYIKPEEINDDKYKGIKDYVNLSVFEVDRELFPSLTYPKEKLGNNIALRWFDNCGHTSVLTPPEMAEIIKTLFEENPTLTRHFLGEMTYQAFYGMEKTKSY